MRSVKAGATEVRASLWSRQQTPKRRSLFPVQVLRQCWRMLLSSLMCLCKVQTNVQSGTHSKDDQDYF